MQKHRQFFSAFFLGFRQVFTVAIISGLVITIVILLLPSTPWTIPFRTYTVITGSMQPRIPIGGLVFVDQRPSIPKVGQVIAFQSPQNSADTIIHRIYAVHAEGIQTKGDYNETVDQWLIQPSAIHGRAIFVIPTIGLAADFLRSPIGLFLLLIAPTLLGIWFSLQTVWRGIRELQLHQSKPPHSHHLGLIGCAMVLFTILTQITSPHAYAWYRDSLPINNIKITTLTKDACDYIIHLHQTGTSTKITVKAETQGGTQKITVQSHTTSNQSQTVTTRIFQSTKKN